MEGGGEGKEGIRMYKFYGSNKYLRKTCFMTYGIPEYIFIHTQIVFIFVWPIVRCVHISYLDMTTAGPAWLT